MTADVARSAVPLTAEAREAESTLYGTDLIRRYGLITILKEDWALYHYGIDKPGLWAVTVYRFGTWSRGVKTPGVRFVLRILYWLGFIFVRNVFGIEFRDTIKLGRRLVIAHQSGIVIHECATIGDDCTIRQNVTFGAGTEWTPGLGPIIGDRVSFGPGTVVIGNVTIGNDVNIGPNCTISTNIPANRTVFVPPPRILPRETENRSDVV